jgi:exodeoxyribonuclease V alpha subunit
MNGEIGNIAYINGEDEEDCVGIKYNDMIINYDFDSLKDTSLAYALSVHKAQGSEAKAVVFVVSSEAKFMLNRELIYTAITRAKEKLYIIGEPGLLHYYSQRIASKRKTSLFDFNNDK